MNPRSSHSTSLFAFVRSTLKNRVLVSQMVKREVVGRYRGSFIGLGWSFLNPIFMLAIYTFVFSVVFQARWDSSVEESKTQFALVLFVGLIVHGLFAEVANRAPLLIQGNVNYVKKVLFPLDILPVVSMGATLFHVLVNITVLLCVFFVSHGYIHWTVIFTPIVLFPLVLLTLGIALILASLGVYMRDIGQSIGIVTTVMLFMAPIFYPVAKLPENYQTLLMLNPLTFIIQQARRVIMFGQLPNWEGLAIYTMVSLIIVWVGYWWFQKTRKGFADVL